MKARKFLSLLLALVMVFAMVIPAMADDPAPETTEAYTVPADVSGKIVILHTNDVHGGIEGYAKVAALKKAFADAGANVLVMDAGDFSQGAPSVNVSQGATAVELMNMVGYDAAAPGNHEFDFGYENLTKLAKDAKFPILAANVKYSGKVAFGDHIVLTAGEKKIGVFGLDTPETATKAHPAKIKGVTFAAGEDLFKIAQAEVDALEKENCDYIICLSHLGIDKESTGNRSVDLLGKVTGISVLIDGHSHSTLDKVQAAEGVTDGKVGDTVITSTGTKIANVGVVILDGETITVESVSADRITVAEDDAIAARAAAIQKEIDDDYGTVFAKTEVELNGEKAPGNRTEETNLGDLICDALVWGAKKNGETVDAALTNGGGIRATVKTGDITKKDVNTVLPFGNTVAVDYVTGAVLLEALEASTYCTPTAIGGFPQVAGIEFTVDTTKAFDEGDLYEGSTYHKPNSIKRVTIQTVGGKEFDEKATYAIATNDFLAAGGDTYYAFSAATANYDLGLPMDEVLMDYIKTELKGTVTAEQYGKPQGRITIKQSVADLFSDLKKDFWYQEAIQYVYDNGLMAGTGNGFSPDANVTRASVLQVFYNMEDKPAVENSAVTDTEGQWYADAVNWAASVGLVEGNTFGEDAVITRGEVRDLFTKYGEVKEADYSSLMNGNESGDLMLEDNLQRSAFAQLLLNASKAGK